MDDIKFGDFRTLYEVFCRSVKQHVRCPHIGHWLPDKNRWKGDEQDFGKRLGYRKRSSMELMSLNPWDAKTLPRFSPPLFLVVFKMESEDSIVLLIKLSPVPQVETKSEHFEFG